MSNYSQGFIKAYSAPSAGDEANADVNTGLLSFAFVTGAGPGATGKKEPVFLSGGLYTALTVPSGAKAYVIEIPTSATSLTFKGATGDTGQPVDGTLSVPITMPIRGTATPGFTNNGSDVTVEVTWL